MAVDLNWILVSSTNCTPISIQITEKTGLNITGLFSFSTSKFLQVFTTNSAKINTYQMQVIGQVTSKNGVLTKIEEFNLTIENRTLNCLLTKLSTISISSQSYTIGDPPLLLVFDSWTQPLAYCSLISYQSQFTDGTKLNSNFISFNATERKFAIYSEDLKITAKSPYTIRVIGILDNDVENYTDFELRIGDPCPKATMLPTN